MAGSLSLVDKMVSCVFGMGPTPRSWQRLPRREPDSVFTRNSQSSARLASALPLEPSDTFPAVFATSRMVALMEIASARLLHACLNIGEMFDIILFQSRCKLRS